MIKSEEILDIGSPIILEDRSYENTENDAELMLRFRMGGTARVTKNRKRACSANKRSIRRYTNAVGLR